MLKSAGTALLGARSRTNFLGRLELTQQPQNTFYKDEGGAKWCYLFVFFCVRAERTDQLKQIMDRVESGRRKIKVSCELLHEDCKPVEEEGMLVLLGSSRPETQDPVGTEPEFDPVTFTGSVRYRIQKVSTRNESRGFRVKIALKGLEDVIEPAITEPTVVLSKRKLLRKKDRMPEHQMRLKIEDAARQRNFEVEQKLARCAPSETPLIHELGGPGSGFTLVPDFPGLRKSTGDMNEEDDFLRPGKRIRGLFDGHGIDAKVEESNSSEIADLKLRVQLLENHLKHIENTLLGSIPGGLTTSSMSGANAAKGKKFDETPPPPPLGRISDVLPTSGSLQIWDAFSKNLSAMFQLTHSIGNVNVSGTSSNSTNAAINALEGMRGGQDKAAHGLSGTGKAKRARGARD